jgi:hypothetical protein
MHSVVSAVAFISLLVVVDSLIGEPFTLDCQLPFENIKKHHAIDDNCDAKGQKDPTDPPANVEPHELQNKTKNNFCATAQNPALVTFVSFRNLQQKIYGLQDGNPWGKSHLPTDHAVEAEDGHVSMVLLKYTFKVIPSGTGACASWALSLEPISLRLSKRCGVLT